MVALTKKWSSLSTVPSTRSFRRISTGTRLVLTLALELGRRKKTYGVASACIGGGQGIAILIKR